MKAQQQTVKNMFSTFYANNYEHIVDELRKLDLLIQLRVINFRAKIQAMQEMAVSQRMYISHEEVDLLLAQDIPVDPEHSQLTEIHQRFEVFRSEINNKVVKSMEQGVFLTLPQLAHLFALSPFELQTIIICLAPELNRKYDKLYAYLQDDITRKKPSVDLALDLLCGTEVERWKVRTLFSDYAPLFRARILSTVDDPQSPSGSSDLARFLKLDSRILNYILGNNSIDGRLSSIAELYLPSSSMDSILVDSVIKGDLLRLAHYHFSEQGANRKRLVLYFHGPYGVGKRELALGICGQLNYSMLYLDVELLLANEPDLRMLLGLAFREGLLLQAALYLDNMDILLKDDDKLKGILKTLMKVIVEYGWLIFLAGRKPWLPESSLENVLFHATELTVPDVPLRETAWKEALDGLKPDIGVDWTGPLARQFRLTPGQIRDAAEFVKNRHSMRDRQEEIALTDLYIACRSQSNQKLEELAIKIDPRYGWDDIVLPENKLEQLKEICSQVKYRYRVFGEWGFDKKLSHGKGLSVLFSGPPGTGKTMAAQVIAHELQLDLYKIDLSGVVSKYIGETEKNLSKIFYEAETSNAILFFDEADALFGKRTEVSDAHDRYANIEVSYLLQKMEEYEGVVILATNLRRNIDEAFARRIRFIVDFPFPDEASRLQIWKNHFPRETPVSHDIDYEFLSKQLQIAGGNIKNIVLNAAFLAVEDGNTVSMKHIMSGVKREFEKIGKLWDGKNTGRGKQL